MTDKVILRLTDGPLKGKKLEFSEHDTFIFGRVDDCHFNIPNDDYLSRHHFLLEVNPPDARIRDLGSLNGTYVNKMKIGGRLKNESPEEGANREYSQVDLHDGDEIKTGDTCFLVEILIEKPVNSIIQCQRCRKDVSSEINSRREGEFLCADCQKDLASSPGEILHSLFNNNLRQNQNLQIPEYEIISLLGAGGMGEVYQARHKQTGIRTAVKVMLSKVAVTASAREKFVREIQTTSTLQHPNIVRFIESGSSGSVFYIIMEYCNNGNLFDFVEAQSRPFTEKEVVPFLLGVLDGFAYAHSEGFVHRDLKPQNILLTKVDNTLKVKVSDFGLSKNFTQAGFSGMTVTGSYAGSYPFMPREQVTNFKYVKPSSDVWSIAATFYFVLTGELPREIQKGQDPMDAILRGNIIPIRNRNSQISKGFANIIDRALSNNLKDRYHDACEMKKAFENVI
jgi:hypothetical protein